jgi:alkanesulfonate monooxygenase SsuD/methylene tetrahydromethanopterin reductase-like flavin-dependent oxidoreductase (luciferase family)
MNYGCLLTGPLSNIVELAQEAEHAEWDGVFLPDDWMTAWITLTAIAMRTHRIHLVTMLTPLPEQLPWYVAAQTATLDQLSNGRAILTAGLGVLDLDKFGMQEMRAGVDWRTHAPRQTPRIPIWVVGGPRQSQLRRAARWDGAVVGGSPEEVRERKATIEALRTSPLPLDIITEGQTPSDDPARAAAIVRPYAEAGATWWLESRWEDTTGTSEMRTRIRSGPPRLS